MATDGIKSGNGTATTLPNYSNAMIIRSTENTPDIGMYYISADTAFVTNSGD